jgi:hypothetical protein
MNFTKQQSNNQLRAKYNLNKKVALIQDLNSSEFLKEGRFVYVIYISYSKIDNSSCVRSL